MNYMKLVIITTTAAAAAKLYSTPVRNV